MLTRRGMRNFPSAQTFRFFDGEVRVQWLEGKGKLIERCAVTDASGHDSQKLAELVATTDGER